MCVFVLFLNYLIISQFGLICHAGTIAPPATSSVAVYSEKYTDLNIYKFVYDQIIDTISSVSLTRCASLCQLRIECVGFLYDTILGTCRLCTGLQAQDTIYFIPVNFKMYKSASYVIPAPLVCRTDLGYKELTYDAITYCLLVSNDRLAFYDASNRCRQDGATLIYANGLAGFKYNYEDVMEQFGSTHSNFWVGLSEVNGDWTWDYNGEPLTEQEDSTINWDVPNHGRSCAGYDTNHYYFDGRNCNDDDEFICEIVLY